MTSAYQTPPMVQGGRLPDGFGLPEWWCWSPMKRRRRPHHSPHPIEPILTGIANGKYRGQEQPSSLMAARRRYRSLNLPPSKPVRSAGPHATIERGRINWVVIRLHGRFESIFWRDCTTPNHQRKCDQVPNGGLTT